MPDNERGEPLSGGSPLLPYVQQPFLFIDCSLAASMIPDVAV